LDYGSKWSPQDYYDSRMTIPAVRTVRYLIYSLPIRKSTAPLVGRLEGTPVPGDVALELVEDAPLARDATNSLCVLDGSCQGGTATA
jgi:hypothetical protein